MRAAVMRDGRLTVKELPDLFGSGTYLSRRSPAAFAGPTCALKYLDRLAEAVRTAWASRPTWMETWSWATNSRRACWNSARAHRASSRVTWSSRFRS
jgi:hypothetical protein